MAAIGTPIDGWTDNGDGSWTYTAQASPSAFNVDAVLTELLARPRITVSDVPPSDPRTNDLWFQPS